MENGADAGRSQGLRCRSRLAAHRATLSRIGFTTLVFSTAGGVRPAPWGLHHSVVSSAPGVVPRWFFCVARSVAAALPGAARRAGVARLLPPPRLPDETS